MNNAWKFVVIFLLPLAGCDEQKSGSAPGNSGAAKGSKAAAPLVVKNVDASGAAARLKESPDLVVLDIRTPQEFAEGHIAGAKNIDFKAADFEARLGKLDRSKPYLVHCRSGARSGQSMSVFEKLNFENVIHLNTGFNDWKSSGQPVEQ